MIVSLHCELRVIYPGGGSGWEVVGGEVERGRTLPLGHAGKATRRPSPPLNPPFSSSHIKVHARAA